MRPQHERMPDGGGIDRQSPLQFQFNGKTMTGYRGDTLASALLANGVSQVARSFRYHRPRGIMTAGPEEPNALLTVGTGADHEPNVRATTKMLYDGLVARSQNCWPTPGFDLGAMPGWISRFLPVGFYYKTFMWPRWTWYEGLIRRMAGLGTAPVTPDPDRYDKRFAHCDVLIVGGGPSGIAAALAAAHSGASVILADEQIDFGGSQLWERQNTGGNPGAARIADMLAALRAMDNVQLLIRTAVVAAYDHNAYTAVELVDEKIRQRLWRIRAQRMVLASGATERPLVFPDNDRPGIMLAGAARHYVNRYAVRPGKLAVIFTNNDDAYRTALDLHHAGITIAAVIDVRRSVAGDLPQRVRNLGIRILSGNVVCRTRGRRKLRSIEVSALSENGSIAATKSRINCDLLCMSGGWSPNVQLLSQAGGKLRFDSDLLCFVPSSLPEDVEVTGAANGSFSVDDGFTFEAAQAYWQTPDTHSGLMRRRQWVDFMHDVTAEDIAQAAREGFTSVEHLKRYTTIGMGADQGKTSNVNALAVLSEVTGRSIASVGTTTFRPPLQPVTLGALAGRDIGPLSFVQRQLPLNDWHKDAGAVMEDHSGWQRPACYLRDGEREDAAIRREVQAARNGVVIFDSSSLGKIEVCGPDAARFLNRIYINNVESLQIGRVRYGIMLNENGIVIDDGVFARLADNRFHVCTSSAGTASAVIALEEWLQTEWPELNVLINNVTTQWATLTLIGPSSREVIGQLLPDIDVTVKSFPHMSVMQGRLKEMPYRLMRVSFTGETSFELNIPAGYAQAAWQALLDAGIKHDVMPLGMEALDVLRIEKGYLEVGVDTDVSTSPLDVGWGVPISRKTTDFIGKRSLARAENTRPGRLQLIGLKLRKEDKFVPVGSHLIDHDSNTSEGHITSSCVSPTLGQSIAMAMLKSGHKRQGETVLIDIDRQLFDAEVVPLVFYDPEGDRLNENISN